MALALIPVLPFLSARHLARGIGALAGLLVLQVALLALFLLVPVPLGRPQELDLVMASVFVSIPSMIAVLFLGRATFLLSKGSPTAVWGTFAALCLLRSVVYMVRWFSATTWTWRWVVDWSDLEGLSLPQSADPAGFNVLWNRLYWLAAGSAALIFARFAARRKEREQAEPANRASGVLPVILFASFVAAVEGSILWGLRGNLSDLAGSSALDTLRNPTAIICCAFFCSGKKRGRFGLVAIAAGVLAALAALRLIDAFDFSWSFVVVRLAFDIAAWSTLWIVLAAVSRRWPDSPAALGLACLAFTAAGWICGPLLPLLYVGHFSALQWSKLAGAAWGLRPALLSQLYGLSVAAIVWVLCVSRSKPARWTVVGLVPLALLLGTLNWLSFRSLQLEGIWDSSVESVWWLASLARQGTPYDEPQPKVTSGKVRIEIGQAGDSAVVAGHYVLRNEGLTPINTLVTSFDRWAEDAHASLGDAAPSLAVDRFGGVAARVAIPLAPGAEWPFDFAYSLKDTLTGGGPAGLGGSVVLVGWDAMPGPLPAIGIGPAEQTLLATQWRQKSGAQENPDELRNREGASPDADSATLQLDLELVAPAGWMAQTVGFETDRLTKDGREVSHFHLAGTPKDVAVVAAAYQATSAAAGQTTVKVLTTATRDSETGAELLSAMRDALRFEVDALGALPAKTLTFAEVPQYQLKNAARAFPALVLISDRTLRDFELGGEARRSTLWTVAHEIAHQWFPLAGGFSLAGDHVSELTASGLAFAWLRQLDAPATRDLIAKRAAGYFAACLMGGENPVAILSGNESTCSQMAVYDKGGLGQLALSDLMGAERYRSALRATVATAGPRSPPYPAIDERLREALLSAGGPAEAGSFLHDLWNRTVTYQNVAESASVLDDGVVVTVTAHRFNGGAGPLRRETNEESYLPIGGIDCAGKPVVLKWVKLAEGVPTRLELGSGEQLTQVGVDPWGYMLDDGGKNLVTVRGSTCASL